MDALKQIDGIITAAVVAKGEESILIPLDEDGAPLNEDLLFVAMDKGMTFAGVFGIVNGVAGCKADSLEYMPAMLSALPAFLQYVRERLKHKTLGDSVPWLESLFKLEDPRDCN